MMMTIKLTEFKMKSGSLGLRLAAITALFQRWDKLIARLTNTEISNKDLEAILALWEESEPIFSISEVQFELNNGEQFSGYGASLPFYELKPFSNFLAYKGSDQDAHNLEMINTRRNTLRVRFY